MRDTCSRQNSQIQERFEKNHDPVILHIEVCAYNLRNSLKFG